jgi:hypothetical protein
MSFDEKLQNHAKKKLKTNEIQKNKFLGGHQL